MNNNADADQSRQRGSHLRRDLLLRRVGLDRLDLIAKVRDHRRRARVELGQPPLQRLGIVVLPPHQRLARHVVDARHLGRRKLLVIGAPARRVHPTTRDPLHQHRVWHRKVEHRVDRLPPRGHHLRQLLRLRHGPREPVQHEARPALGRLRRLRDQPHDNLVRHQRPALHRPFRLQPQRRLRRHRRAQHVARRQVAQAVVRLDHRRLRSLAAPRRPDQDQTLLGLVQTVEPAPELGEDCRRRQRLQRLLRCVVRCVVCCR
mmetsp:Transcript_9656/g.26248  ORF Transcript_9656/g.26248 Transcript_9656/m.26248 type:complete len:260 (+) Transcript_9656:1-780(+)